MIDFYLREAVLDQKEGIMINKNDGLYKTKRTDDLLKVKVFHTVDLEVTGYGEGEGKYKDMLGYLVVDYKGNPLRVGSGLSDEERTILFRYADELVGRIVEVSYFEESQNEDGKLSLRFPVFKGFRDDKDEPSYS
jgi:DNA ligase-1